ncbi:hypothetical protein BUALT_Bualt03G0117700 [Buddleja alternifolia]|uniref:tRNA-uridine aminocarboxypropyltransferase n=1 Tax=Buddleja alternifolia TaxID=168488 RepID=A0AAV6Y132_9LAMI|nr:hypothetical protein BUALT_Bualt03G0117700 [Buddleja alternifolia]
MPPHLLTRIGLQQGNLQFFTFLNPSTLSSKIPTLPQTKTLIYRMVTQSGSTKRPTCPACSKPTRVCLCNRLQTPALSNSVTVTILQHSLEKNHPLNSTRIANIGLKNVDVVTVSDVNFQARVFIWLLESRCEVVRTKLDENRHLFDEMPSREDRSNILGQRESGSVCMDLDGQITEMRDMCKNGMSSSLNLGFLTNSTSNAELESGSGEVDLMSCTSDEAALRGSGAPAIDFTIEKFGAISSYNHCWMTPNKSAELSFDQLLTSDIANNDIRKGFIVKKLQKKPLEGSNGYQEIEEFEIAVPPGSVLLFPSEQSIDVGAVNFEVKNLIVLDGTWAKAKRMYNESPWLRLLPHVRLDIDKLSLYREVRHQPRAGYLSTIESIVYALKVVEEEDSKGLDGLLDVFESMVGDQRRCKDERLIRASEI